jgi:Kef-type K+ transport system membrane component KefB
LDATAGVLALLAAALLAGLGGLGSRSLLILAHRDRSQTLVIFLGTVTLVAGLASELRFSPIFGAMLVGVVISNLAGPHLRAYEWFILRAEHAVANVFFLLAGVLIEPGIGRWGWGIIGLLVVARLVAKRPLLHRALEPATGVVASGSTLVYTPIRQAPIAIALAVSLVLAEWSYFNVRLLTVVVLVGLISDLLPTGLSMFVRRGDRLDSAQKQSNDGDRVAVQNNA